MTKQRVLIGASTGPGLGGLETFVALRLGNCVLADMPIDMDEAAAMARFCREHQITLFWSELVWRGSTDLWRPAKQRLPRKACPSREQINAVLAEAGEFYGGRMTIGEAGGVLYWPKDYLSRETAGAFVPLPECEGMLEAREAYLRYMREFIDFERRELSDGPLMNVDSSLVFRYHAEAGIDVLCHEALPGDPHRMQAAIRGAARAYGKPWGTHIAMGWYGGVTVDELWLKRWKTSVYHCYLTGSEFIYPESGHLALTDHQTGQRHEARSPEMLQARHILREAHQFSLIHERPAGPKVTLGLVSGYGDGAPGLWNPWAWGQFHDDKWLAGPAEWGWELVDDLHRRADWPTYSVQGEHDWSGQPPYGQYDIVPIECSLENLRRYTCLVFPGWNTMTEEIWGKLKAYVEGGGHLLMWLPQLRADDVRGGAPQPFRDGDFSDLFGVKITGRQPTGVRGVKFVEQSSLDGYRFPAMSALCDPRFMGSFTPSEVVLTTAQVLAGHDLLFETSREQVLAQPLLIENRLGAGVAMLVTAWEYPADPGLLPLTKELLRVASAGEQGSIRLLGSDRVRYAVYDLAEDAQVIYLLNTDPDCAAPVRLWVEGRLSPEFTVPANEMLVAYRFGPVVVQFADKLVNLEAREGDELTFALADAQAVLVANVGHAARTITINGTQASLPAGGSATLDLARRETAGNPAFAPDFADEPGLAGEIDSRTAY